MCLYRRWRHKKRKGRNALFLPYSVGNPNSPVFRFHENYGVRIIQFWRRRRDLNSRAGNSPTYTLSRGASSANLSTSPNKNILNKTSFTRLDYFIILLYDLSIVLRIFLKIFFHHIYGSCSPDSVF